MQKQVLSSDDEAPLLFPAQLIIGISLTI